MKFLAHTDSDLRSEIISVLDAQQRRSRDPARWEKKTYYSLWHLTPMCLRAPKDRKASFAFLPGSTPHPSEAGGGESYEHELAKHLIREQGFIFLKGSDPHGRTVDVKLDFAGQADVEYRYEDGIYIADVQGTVANANAFLLEPGTPLAIEICNTHKVNLTKQQYYRDRNIAAVEIEIWEKLKFVVNPSLLRKQMAGWLTNPRYFKWLHNPNYQLFKREY